MNLELITDYVLQYGYIIIILSLFCGIVGIPAPEESFMVLIGILVAKQQLDLFFSLSAAFTGVLLGMVAAYLIGRKVGTNFIHRFGKYMYITKEKWEDVSYKFHRYGQFAIIIAFFLPGFRQLSPYIAGTSRYPFIPYLFFSTIGNILWLAVFIVGGYYLGNRIPLKILAWIPFLYVAVFTGLWIKKKISKA